MPMNPSVTTMKMSDLLPIEYSWRSSSPLGRPRPPRRRDKPRTMPAIVDTYTSHSSIAARDASTTAAPTFSIRDVMALMSSRRVGNEEVEQHDRDGRGDDCSVDGATHADRAAA